MSGVLTLRICITSQVPKQFISNDNYINDIKNLNNCFSSTDYINEINRSGNMSELIQLN